MKKPVISDKERMLLAEIDKRVDDLDWEFIGRVVANTLLKLDDEQRVSMVLSFIESIVNIYERASARLVVECIDDERLTVDQSMDILGDIMKAGWFVHTIGRVIEHMAEPDDNNPGVVGVLTPDAQDIGKAIEQARIKCVRALGKKRRAARR